MILGILGLPIMKSLLVIPFAIFAWAAYKAFRHGTLWGAPQGRKREGPAFTWARLICATAGMAVILYTYVFT